MATKPNAARSANKRKPGDKPVTKEKGDPNNGHPTTWDHTAFFDKEIAPLTDRVFELCKAKGLPYVSGFAISHNDKTTGVVSSHVAVNGGLPEPIRSAALMLDRERSEIYNHPAARLLGLLNQLHGR